MAVMFQRVPRDVMDANHAAARASRPATPPTRTANLDTVLDLGDTVYLAFRGRAFGVPPVAWRTGQRLLQLRLAAMAAAGDGVLTPATSPAYYQALGKLAQAIWAHVYPTGWVPRILKRCRLLGNPFQDATEAELVGLTDFLLQRRMASGIGFQPAAPHPKFSTP